MQYLGWIYLLFLIALVGCWTCIKFGREMVNP